MSAPSYKELASNRRASFEYTILDTFEAGVQLQGTEIKSIRDNGASLQEAYVKVLKDALWLIGCHIAPYRFGNIHNHEEKRDRKLLMHKREIEKLRIATQEKGITLIPLSLYLKNGRIKLKLATAKGKKLVDKRQSIREGEEKRNMQRAIKRVL